MTDMPQIRLAFNSHGLGDVVHAATALRLFVHRGYDVQIQVEPNKRWLWQAAGIPIYDGDEPLPIHPYYYPDDFLDLFKPDHTHSKIAHLFEVAELPKLGTKEDVWRMVCSERIDASAALSERVIREVEDFLKDLPRPIVLLHSKGTNWQEKKSIPDATAFALICELLASFDGSVVTLDWDERAPTLGSRRVRSICPHWGHMSSEHFGALCQLSDLLIGVDSGPFHLAGWFDIPTLYVSREIPPVRCCLPSPNATYLVPARDHGHWIARGPEWKFAEFQGTEATVMDIVILANEILSSPTKVAVMTALALDSIPGLYTYCRVGHDERPMELLRHGKIGQGAAGCERSWRLEDTPIGCVLTIVGEGDRPTCHLKAREDGVLCGRWLQHERMPIELVRQDNTKPDPPLTVRWNDLEPIPTPQVSAAASQSIPGVYTYHRVGHDQRRLELNTDGTIGEGAGEHERGWRLQQTPTGPVMMLYGDHGGPTCHLSLDRDGTYRGRWYHREQMPIELIRQPDNDKPAVMVPAAGRKTGRSGFVVGIPTLNRFDLLSSCIDSILVGSVLPDAIYVLDNSCGQWSGHPSGLVKIITPVYNLGCARSWNLLLNLTQPAPMIIVSDDVDVGHNGSSGK